MRRLYVGCRVRIVWCISWPELSGQEGRIVAKCSGEESLTGRADWLVAPDAWGSPIAPRVGANGAKRFGPESNQLEPIQDPGHQVVSWDACLWQPEGTPA